MFIVYFSSTTRNTDRFVQKLDIPSARLPLRRGDEPLTVDEPFVLVCPTYGGGASITGDNSRPVPKQVIQFLNDPSNRELLRGVIASGNINFGEDFCKAGDIISAKCKVPYLYRFELMGTPHDVERVTEGLAEFEAALRAEGRWESRQVSEATVT
ncbi:MAG TPA: class Ib ribonucleoside-diphosphate reductase assembly flavoprotein NrdI [Candidatus Corynebacterium avicola]|uniref:Protein NrdI n=1 Tax=Candidatus Corynebacterium avicola TaxID=2838527 RepID=A0A9D1UJG8_9CORY|nr:class Ib ribonucleoside-diphosphate reductase assembly flavoprotein NrdI [Candidatus Corynebacterium avicola]